jgi:precorrin-6B methylase 2
MTRTTNEQIISLNGHITGVKRELRILAVQLSKLEKKMETLFWSILCGLGALSLALITIFLAK